MQKYFSEDLTCLQHLEREREREREREKEREGEPSVMEFKLNTHLTYCFLFAGRKSLPLLS